jgi:hypothetical protein
VTTSVKRALQTEEPLQGIEAAFAALAIATAQMVDAGSVAAIPQLRAVLLDLAGRVDDDTAAFLRSLRIPRVLP